MGKKKDIIHLESESVIPVLKHKLVAALSNRIEERSDRNEFHKLCQRVEYTIRAWYLLQFEDLMQLYAFFEPVHGGKKLEQQNLSPEDIDSFEENFLTCLFQVMDKSNFKVISDDEIDIALSAQYRLNLPIVVDESKVDKRLFTKFFAKHPHDNLPSFADKFIIFRRGFGLDHMTAYFIIPKINTILARLWKFFMMVTGLKRLFKKKRPPHSRIDEKPVEISVDAKGNGLYVERIRIEKMRLSIPKLVSKITIQEPTFERIIVVYRRVSSKKERERNIYVKHFKSIPMADMEIVLPEKKNPGLTPMDWVKFLVSAVIGMGTVVGSLSNPKADVRVILAILFTVSNLVSYQSLITRSVYDKQLDSGRGTLLHLCDEVIQQEVKEVIVSFFILMEQGKATGQELDQRCEDFIKEEFGETCNFDIDDAIQKLRKLGIVSQDSNENYTCVDLRQANEIIGTTTEEVVIRAQQVDTDSTSPTKHSDRNGKSSSRFSFTETSDFLEDMLF